MIHSLYTNKDIFLRELISNASDACDKLRYAAITEPKLLKEGEELRITVSVDSGAKTLTISDNGVGMSRDELIDNLGTIARSGTQEFVSQLSGDTKKDVPLIGQFGVGFYSAFMVADKVRVVSRKAGEDKAHSWESEGEGEFTIGEETLPGQGTCITLFMRDDAKEYLDEFRLKHIIQTYSDHIAFPIAFVGKEGKEEVVNSGTALWTRPKSDISDEQYQEFYRHVSHTPEKPWMTLHQKAEGMVEYTALLYVPGMKPFDLFHPDRKTRVKLYIRRVYITDEGVELIPAYLRFLRGVIDSEDLPLNISRETLQSSPVITRIREAITNKIFSGLKQKAEKEPEEYAKFWENFGPVVKEGLCEQIAPKEKILEISRFHSTFPDSKTVGLDDYISRMKEGQEHIYVLTGDKLEALRGSPQLEGFTRRGVEVLLLTDHVDDFWLSVVPTFKGKSFKSVTRADIDLSKFDDEKAEDKKEKTDEKKLECGRLEALIAKVRTVLGESVKDVRTSSKLASSPVCLAVDEGAMDIRLERFLIEQKQLPAGMAKILEINPKHPIILHLGNIVEDKEAKSELEDIVWLLFDQARLLEGEQISDPAAFSRRLSKFVEKSFAA